MSIELSENTRETRANTARITQINDWRSDDGPLKREFRRVRSEIVAGDRELDDKIDTEKAWRHTMRGALIAASVFVPIVTGIVVAVVVKGLT